MKPMILLVGPILISNSQQNGILLPKLSWPTVRKKCSSDREKLLKFEATGQEFAKILKSQEQFVKTVKGKNNLLKQWKVRTICKRLLF